MNGNRALRILHCFRSPVGGIFRHVRDLVAVQAAGGHKVGILCDSSTGGALEDALFDEIRPQLELGLVRIPMRRAITPGDLWTLAQTFSGIRKMNPDILHSHGAKGGAHARIIGTLLRASGIKVGRLYCPHGGTIHYDSATLKGGIFFKLERLLERMTDRLIFVSEYELSGYREKVGEPRCPSSLVYNGLRPEEFEPVEADRDAADFLFVGMMRDLKGPDVFLEALAALNKVRARPATAHMVGDGPDLADYHKLADSLGLKDCVKFHAPMPVRQAFALARTVVIPSRAESMPYVVLEAIAARRPIIATRVGGIPEILTAEADRLIEAGDANALSRAMINALDQPEESAATDRRAEELRSRFSVATMARDVERAYAGCL